MNSTMTSSLAAGAAVPISRHFNEYDEYKLILPTSMYLVGYACGPMLWGPLSESYGRKGTMAATTFGPILGPLVSGYIAVVSWSWAFWVGAIFAGATWPLFYFFDETYGPTILKRRAHRLRKETGDERIAAPLELEKTDLNHIVTVILTRPLRMICFEPLSYPIIFQGIYHFNAGETGIAFLPIGVGAVISAGIYLSWDSGPFFVISAFWLGWTSREGIHWIVPTLAGILFGMGYLCLFMALLNYLVDAYEVFAARQKKMEEEKERESERAKEKERARLMANEVSAETNEIKAKEDV
ncbi:unnamed protein product [Alternaria alternata]